MTEYIYDPISATVREYLMSVQDAPVHGTAPEKKPARFIQISPVGGVEGVVSQRPMVTFICWDETDARSARFAETVIAHMRGCRSLGGLPVYGIRTIGLPVPRPDPESGRPRYQFTLEIQVRGKPFEAP